MGKQHESVYRNTYYMIVVLIILEAKCLLKVSKYNNEKTN